MRYLSSRGIVSLGKSLFFGTVLLGVAIQGARAEEEREELERELLEPERPFSWAWISVETSSSNASAARNTISRQEARFLKSIAGERSI